jgi:2-oxoglutarate ferredoxin oxidoreductase subunit alpha
VLSAEQLEQMKAFYRYLDVDSDGVAARTLPGTHAKGAYFTRGSGHNKYGGYTEDANEYTEVMARLAHKIDSARAAVPAPVVHTRPGARVGIISVGGCNAAVLEAVEQLAGQGVPADYLRVRGFPFAHDVEHFINTHDTTFVVEQNRDAQLRSLLTLELDVGKNSLKSVLSYGGMPLSSDHVVNGVLEARP